MRGIGAGRTGPQNVLALPIPDTKEEDGAVIPGWVVMPSTWGVSALWKIVRNRRKRIGIFAPE